MSSTFDADSRYIDRGFNVGIYLEYYYEGDAQVSEEKVLTTSERCTMADSYSPLNLRAIRSSCHFRSFSMSFGSLSRGEEES